MVISRYAFPYFFIIYNTNLECKPKNAKVFITVFDRGIAKRFPVSTHKNFIGPFYEKRCAEKFFRNFSLRNPIFKKSLLPMQSS